MISAKLAKPANHTPCDRRVNRPLRCSHLAISHATARKPTSTTSALEAASDETSLLAPPTLGSNNIARNYKQRPTTVGQTITAHIVTHNHGHRPTPAAHDVSTILGRNGRPVPLGNDER
jgi:hypothetical protein